MGKKGRKLKVCPERLVSLLGKLNDVEIAERAKVSVATSRRWRMEAGHEVVRTHAGKRKYHAKQVRESGDRGRRYTVGETIYRLWQETNQSITEIGRQYNLTGDSARKLAERYAKTYGLEWRPSIERNQTRRLEFGRHCYAEMEGRLITAANLAKEMGMNEKTVAERARDWARANNAEWPPFRPSPGKQERAYHLRRMGLKWRVVQELCGYTHLTHAGEGARRWAEKNNLPKPSMDNDDKGNLESLLMWGVAKVRAQEVGDEEWGHLAQQLIVSLLATDGGEE